MKRRKREKIINIVSLVVSAILLLSSIVFLFKVIGTNLVPLKYTIILIILTTIYNGVLLFILIKKKMKIIFKIVVWVLVFLSIIFEVILYGYINKAFSFIDTIKVKGYKTENYSVLVPVDSEINTIEDLKNKQISYVKDLGNSNDAMKKLKNEVDIASYNKVDVGELVEDLINKMTPAILIENSYIELYSNEYKKDDKSFSELVKSIYSFSVEIKQKEIVKEVDVTKDTFVLYISGIDTFGDITNSSLSDVNIVGVINPKTKQVLLISIPRDYYVKLHGVKTDMKDKLTHAAMYGIDMSVHTIEDLLDIDINYYLKVNFTSVIDIVNALGGIEVDSKYAFTSYKYKYKKGINKLNGEQALYFCRERYSFSGGDRARGQNQEAVIAAIIKKVATPSILTNSDRLLKAVEGKFETNIGTDNIAKLIRMQLDDMASWNVKSISLNGTDDEQYSYSFNKQKRYVMQPDAKTIKRAQDLINDVKGNLILDSTDDSETYKVNNKPKPISSSSSSISSSTTGSSSSASSNQSSSNISSIKSSSTSRPLSSSNSSKSSNSTSSSSSSTSSSSSSTTSVSSSSNMQSSSSTVSSSSSSSSISASSSSTSLPSSSTIPVSSSTQPIISSSSSSSVDSSSE